MTICTTRAIAFSRCKGRKVEGKFNGGDITSDGGVLLLREADRKLGEKWGRLCFYALQHQLTDSSEKAGIQNNELSRICVDSNQPCAALFELDSRFTRIRTPVFPGAMWSCVSQTVSSSRRTSILIFPSGF